MFGKKKEEKESPATENIRAQLGIIREELNYMKERMEKLEKVLEGENENTHRSKISNFQNPEDYQKFKDICDEIAAKDETFRFESNPEKREIELISEDKNVLHKKSLWLINRTGIQDLKYTVK